MWGWKWDLKIGLCRIMQCSSACPLLNTLASIAPEIPGSSSKRVNTLINVGFVISAASERLFLAPGFGTFAITRAFLRSRYDIAAFASCHNYASSY